MALRDCHECRKPISTEAPACPHCGCPLKSGKKKHSYLGVLLMILAGLIVIATFTDRGTTASKPSSTMPRCDADAAKEVVQQALNGGILHRVEGKPEVSRVYILEPWYHLTIDDKKLLDNVVQCMVTNGAPNGKTIVVYHDGRTGKELATSNRFGFEME